MAKSNGVGEQNGKDGRKGRAPLSPSGPTRPSTYRISPGGIATISALSARLGLNSQAGAIETAAAQLLDALERCDRHPPLAPEQLAVAVAAIRMARIIPRTVGPTAKVGIILLAAMMANEATAVPAECTAAEYAALIESVRRFTPAESLWAIAAAVGE